ncbi:MAG: immunoglobulin domain-containing protein, partial [Limisphaerales bacterium]
MNPKRLLSLSLAGALQVLPLARVAVTVESAASTAPAWAWVLRVASATVALLGSYDAVSGATAIVTPYTVNATVGTPYSRQLTTSGQTAHSWSASTAALGSTVFPLTPGLWLTNSNGRIGGTPTWAGISNITISAWENSGNRGASVSALFVFTVTGNSPPSITTQPQSQTVYAGNPATFTVVASGTAPLSYQWRFQAASISGATASSYTIPSVQTTDAGAYSVVVNNVAGTVTSANATLTVPLSSADLATGIVGPAVVSPGGSATYTIAVTNLGPSAADNVVLVDAFPPTATFATATGGGTASAAGAVWP